MDQDDRQIGRILSRREALALLGASGAAALAVTADTLIGAESPGVIQTPAGTSSTAPCVVRPEQTQGPYFVDEKLNRSDIRSDPSNGLVSAGIPLALTLRVSRAGRDGCTPLAGAQVDLWQCDALGVYSDVKDTNVGFDTVGKKFLRGYQVTDASGLVRFTTIYPGWYQGRTVHVHFKVRTTPAARQGYEFISQLYFDDAITDEVFRAAPYSAKGTRTTRNDRDGIYRRGGQQLMLPVTRSGETYAGTFDLALQMPS